MFNHNQEESFPLQNFDPPQTRLVMEDVEEIPLSTVPGQGCSPPHKTRNAIESCCNDPHHRRLAISSIICGISCIGIKALIDSVKAESATDPEAADRFSRRARKLGIISIVTWVSILVSIPLMLALVSYLMTLVD
ncbi:transmembrane protein 265-like [Gouania willdenowi]|uniref:transmembrane protein 265-like n=1 Tax=Gouania willdenowi TaxID=441366 RepID=UPI0010557B55|nr:transmembrane protein 265 [Gouania willdenowi]XP_028311178.1 transmembrane protein 265 [Gouania willdenowi]